MPFKKKEKKVAGKVKKASVKKPVKAKTKKAAPPKKNSTRVSSGQLPKRPADSNAVPTDKSKKSTAGKIGADRKDSSVGKSGRPITIHNAPNVSVSSKGGSVGDFDFSSRSKTTSNPIKEWSGPNGLDYTIPEPPSRSRGGGYEMPDPTYRSYDAPKQYNLHFTPHIEVNPQVTTAVNPSLRSDIKTAVNPSLRSDIKSDIKPEIKSDIKPDIKSYGGRSYSRSRSYSGSPTATANSGVSYNGEKKVTKPSKSLRIKKITPKYGNPIFNQKQGPAIVNQGDAGVIESKEDEGKKRKIISFPIIDLTNDAEKPGDRRLNDGPGYSIPVKSEVKSEFPKGNFPAVSFDIPVIPVKKEKTPKVTSIKQLNPTFSYTQYLPEQKEEDTQLAGKRSRQLSGSEKNTFEEWLDQHNVPRVKQGKMQNDKEWREGRGAKYEADKIELQESLNAMEEATGDPSVGWGQVVAPLPDDVPDIA